MSSTQNSEGSDTSGGTKKVSAAFDMRTFIAALIGLYGVVLVVVGIIGPSDQELKDAGGVNINLYAGIGMMVVSAFFVTWARLRPVVVPVRSETSDEQGDDRPSE